MSKIKTQLTTITPMSRYLAIGLFLVLPFVFAYIGYQVGYASAVIDDLSGAVITAFPVSIF